MAKNKTYVSAAKSLAVFREGFKGSTGKNAGVEAETEAESESEVETETETETETEAVSEAESESETETDAEDAEEETAVTNNGTEINLNDYKAMFAMADMLVDDSKALQIKRRLVSLS